MRLTRFLLRYRGGLFAHLGQVDIHPAQQLQPVPDKVSAGLLEGLSRPSCSIREVEDLEGEVRVKINTIET